MGAYILWLLWGTGIYHGNQQNELREDLEVRIDTAAAAEPAVLPPVRSPRSLDDRSVLRGECRAARPPGPGMGGHCLPVDPFYLSWKARVNGGWSLFGVFLEF